MDRRHFVRLGLVGTAAGLTVPHAVQADTMGFDPFKTPMAGGLYYTLESPGRWAKKAKGHTPVIERNGGSFQVITPHPMDGYVHYIVKHMILDENFQFVREVLFHPEKDTPITEHDIGNLKNVIYAVSMCNQHDLWLSALKV
jgi:superoxide reductase